jgi:hypothetical protein
MAGESAGESGSLTLSFIVDPRCSHDTLTASVRIMQLVGIVERFIERSSLPGSQTRPQSLAYWRGRRGSTGTLRINSPLVPKLAMTTTSTCDPGKRVILQEQSSEGRPERNVGRNAILQVPHNPYGPLTSQRRRYITIYNVE